MVSMKISDRSAYLLRMISAFTGEKQYKVIEMLLEARIDTAEQEYKDARKAEKDRIGHVGESR